MLNIIKFELFAALFSSDSLKYKQSYWFRCWNAVCYLLFSLRLILVIVIETIQIPEKKLI